jgi:2-polyprenyl-3-methyl-5-hydroxy-6-metoxy-1,4-benzoquinol methylase
MAKFDRKAHWNTVYQTKSLNEFSWYQPVPEISLAFMSLLEIPRDAKIIDVGGGDSLLVDHLLAKGFSDISVLDISAAALERAKSRLGKEAKKVKWIEEDVTAFQSSIKYDFWHDRATFHFLVEEKDIQLYQKLVENQISSGGKMLIGTFSDQGPAKCSGISIRQYTPEKLKSTFANGFDQIGCESGDHLTPSGNVQNFVFCCFNKK